MIKKRIASINASLKEYPHRSNPRHPKYVSDEQYKSIMKLFFKKIMYYMIKDGSKFVIPHFLGTLQIVRYDAENMEVGTYKLTLSRAGEEDELFGYLPSTFQAQLGHKDRARILPDEVVNLASSEYAPYQAIRVPNKPIWSTQFHPELTGDENLERFHRYLEGYANMMSEEEMQETLDRFKDSPETDQLISRFLKLVFG